MKWKILERQEEELEAAELFGFRDQHSTELLIFSLMVHAAYGQSRKHVTELILFDMEKAYGIAGRPYLQVPQLRHYHSDDAAGIFLHTREDLQNEVHGIQVESMIDEQDYSKEENYRRHCSRYKSRTHLTRHGC